MATKSVVKLCNAITGCVGLMFPGYASCVPGSDGANITTITDISTGGASTWTPSASKPTIRRYSNSANTHLALTGKDALRFVNATDRKITVTGISLPAAGHTLVAVVKTDKIDVSANWVFLAGAGDNPNHYLSAQLNRGATYQQSTATVYNWGPNSSSQPTTFSGVGGAYQALPEEWTVIVIQRTSSTGWRVSMNGEVRTFTGGTIAAPITTLYVGASASGASTFSGDIGLIALYDNDIGNSTADALAAELETAFMKTPLPKGLVSFHCGGDSIPTGDYADTQANSLFAKALSLATAVPAAQRRGIRITVPSIQINGWETIFTGGYKVYTNSDAANPVWILEPSSNDIWLGSQTGAATYARMKSAATAIKAYQANARICVCTTLPRQNTNESIRQDYITLVMANTSAITGRLYSKSEASCDITHVFAIHTNTNIGDALDENNTTYYSSDKTHLTTTGHSEYGTDLKTALEWFYANPANAAPTVTGISLGTMYCRAGQTIDLSTYATVTVTGGASQAVTAEIIDSSSALGLGTLSGTTFNASGLTAGQTTTVRLRSVYDGSFWAEGTLTITEAVAPTFLNANVDVTGGVLTINFTEATSPPLLPATGGSGFLLTGGHTLGSALRSSPTQYQCTISPVVNLSETVLLSYTPGNITDSAGIPNALAAFSGSAVTNNSLQPSPSPPSGGGGGGGFFTTGYIGPA